jgi:hypothetical protein
MSRFRRLRLFMHCCRLRFPSEYLYELGRPMAHSDGHSKADCKIRGADNNNE